MAIFAFILTLQRYIIFIDGVSKNVTKSKIEALKCKFRRFCIVLIIILIIFARIFYVRKTIKQTIIFNGTKQFE